MSNRHEWIGRIKAVALEFLATRFATDRLVEEVRRDGAVLEAITEGVVKPGDVARASAALGGTYVVRMFAEFETGLRLYWLSQRETTPRTRDLLDGVAAHRKVSPDVIETAHAVREYRNALVHERDERPKPVLPTAASSHLCRFFSFLPLTW